MAYEIPAYTISDNEKIAVDFYLACNTKVAAIRLLRKLDGELRNLSPDGEKSAATKFFQKGYVIDYMQSKEMQLVAKYQSQDVVGNYEDNSEKAIDLISANEETRRKFLLKNYNEILRSATATDSDKIAANKAITDLLNAKEKEDETNNSALSKYVHFVVPMSLCDNCPNKDQLLKENQHFATDDEIQEAFYKKKKGE